MKLNKIITAELSDKERCELLGNARNVDECISADDFVDYIESLINRAIELTDIQQ